MTRANAALAPKERWKIAKLIVHEGWSVSTAAKQYMVSWPTAKRWADRYRAHGKDGMAGRLSRPLTSRTADTSTPTPER